MLVENGCGTYYSNGAFMPQVLYGPTGLFLDGKGDLYVADTLDMLVREVQGNFVAIDLTTPVLQGQTSPTQSAAVENDGNAPLDLASVTIENNAYSSDAEIDTSVTNSCMSNGQTLNENADCEVGAVFAPAISPILASNTQETPIIDMRVSSPRPVRARQLRLSRSSWWAQPNRCIPPTLSSHPALTPPDSGRASPSP